MTGPDRVADQRLLPLLEALVSAMGSKEMAASIAPAIRN